MFSALHATTQALQPTQRACRSPSRSGTCASSEAALGDRRPGGRSGRQRRPRSLRPRGPSRARWPRARRGARRAPAGTLEERTRHRCRRSSQTSPEASRPPRSSGRHTPSGVAREREQRGCQPPRPGAGPWLGNEITRLPDGDRNGRHPRVGRPGGEPTEVYPTYPVWGACAPAIRSDGPPRSRTRPGAGAWSGIGNRPNMRTGRRLDVRYALRDWHGSCTSAWRGESVTWGPEPPAHEGGEVLTSFLEQPSRYLFFTGKGGVGKTALACATAIRLADAGKRILLVSTDPASNLDEMLGAPLSNRPTPIPGVDRLSALNIDPEKAADDYRERVIAPYRAIWTRDSDRRAARAARRSMHRGDRRVRRVRRASGGRRTERAVRPCAVRHGADRTHAEAPQLAARLDGLPRSRPPRAPRASDRTRG